MHSIRPRGRLGWVVGYVIGPGRQMIAHFPSVCNGLPVVACAAEERVGRRRRPLHPYKPSSSRRGFVAFLAGETGPPYEATSEIKGGKVVATLLEHIVLFKLRPETTEAGEEELIQRLRALKDLIPEIIDLSAGRNIADPSRGFSVGLVVRLRDEDALEAYRVHPAHKEVVKYIEAIAEERLAVDYYFPTSTM